MTLRLARTETWLFAGCGLLAALMGLLAGIDARLAIGGSLAIAFTLAALADLAVGLALFTFLGFVVVVPNFAGQTLSVIKLAALPLLFSWFALVTRQGGAQRTFLAVHPAISLLMLLFLSWATITYVWAEDGSAVLTAVFRYSLAISLLFVVFTAVQRERDVILVTGAMALGAVCAAVYGFLSPAEAGIGQLERLSGTLGEANELAAALTVGIGLGGGLLAIAKSPPVRVLIAVGIGFCLLALLQTGSRAGLVAMLAMLVAAIVLARGRRLSLVIVTLTVLLIAIGYYLMAAPEQSRERITNPGSGTGRVDLWTVGLRMVEANPVEGVGAGNFPVSSIHYLLRPGSLPDDQFIADSPKVAHNIYLEVLAELGIPGVAMFLALLLFGLGCSVAALSRFRQMGERRLQALAMSIAVSLVGLLAADFFASEQYERELWLLLGLGPALLAMAKRMERSPRPTP